MPEGNAMPEGHSMPEEGTPAAKEATSYIDLFTRKEEGAISEEFPNPGNPTDYYVRRYHELTARIREQQEELQRQQEAARQRNEYLSSPGIPGTFGSWREQREAFFAQGTAQTSGLLSSPTSPVSTPEDSQVQYGQRRAEEDLESVNSLAGSLKLSRAVASVPIADYLGTPAPVLTEETFQEMLSKIEQSGGQPDQIILSTPRRIFQDLRNRVGEVVKKTVEGIERIVF